MDASFAPNRRALVTGAGAAIAAGALPTIAFARTAPEFVGIEGWLNSGPLSMHGLRGRPVLVNFFARSCINCIRTMPYIRAWHGRYSGRGFTVVGVHTPEFEVEKSREALASAAARLGLSWPIAQDNASATWNAWGNQYWPAEYLVDQRGVIVYSHFGEGAYDETERRIQNLLG